MSDSDGTPDTPPSLKNIFSKRPWNDPEWRDDKGRTWAEIEAAGQGVLDDEDGFYEHLDAAHAERLGDGHD